MLPIIPDSLLTSLLSNAPDERHQVSHPHKTHKSTVQYIFIFLFLGSKLEDERFLTDWQQAAS